MASNPDLEMLRSTLAATTAGAALEGAPDVFGRPSRAVSCAWETVDGAMSARDGPAGGGDGPGGGARGLVRGGVHEWFGVDGPSTRGRGVSGCAVTHWAPPLFLLAHVARRAVLDATERGAPASVVWVGRRVWPYPRALTDGVEVVETERFLTAGSTAGNSVGEFQMTLALRETPAAFTAEGGTLFRHSLFVDPPDAGLRLWAIDTALRCPGVTVVVADGSGLGMAATRRLQLAAAAAQALVLTARPPGEIREVSAATTRWSVTRAACDGSSGPRWSMALLRAKGAQHLSRSRLRSVG